MSKKKIYTPEGVYDILPEECYAKKVIEQAIRHLFNSFGYREVETPSIEFYDIFTSSQDWIREESMFKFFDASGKILSLRPDITLPIARMVSTKMKNKELPLRLSYIGNVFRFDKFGGGERKESTQAGVELLGAPGPYADAEIIALAIKTLLSAGLHEFQIELGQVEFFKGLMEEYNILADHMELLRELIERKEIVAIREFCQEIELEKDFIEIIALLTEVFGAHNIIERLKAYKLNKRSKAALDNLSAVMGILKDYGYEKYISIDLGMIQKLNYYSGIIFRGFTYGVGFPVISGGRYDMVYEKFGDKLLATGFSVKLNLLMTALARQNQPLPKQKIDSFVIYQPEGQSSAVKICESLRQQGLFIEMDILNQAGNSRGNLQKTKDYAKTKGIDGIIYVVDIEHLELHNLLTGEVVKTTITELLDSD